MLASAIQGDAIHELISKGIEPRHFADQSVAAVFTFAMNYQRSYGGCPSREMITSYFPEWHGETAFDPLTALIDEFLAEVKRRYFESFVVELSQMSRNETEYRDMRPRLDEVLLDAARDMAAVIPSGQTQRFSADFQRRIAIYEEERNRGYSPGIEMGIPILDQETQGLKRGWLCTNAGWSGRGKSMLTTYNLLQAFEQDKTALMLSFEMSAQEVMDRLHTMVMHWQHRDFMRHELSDIQIQRWRDVARIYSKANGEIIVVDKLSGATIDRVHAEIQRYKPDITAIDYVQRMRASYSSRKPRWEMLEEITNELKTVAMDTDTAIIMVSQDGRDSADQGSTATNVGGSVSIYQAADLYIGMFQDEQMEAQRKMRIRCLKFRHGRKPEVDIYWDPATGEFGRLYQDSDQFVKAPA
jgi:replicative DNA helicase